MEITPESLREKIPNWSLQSDKDLLDYMRVISQNLESKCMEISTKIDHMQLAVDEVNVLLGNSTNSFLAMHQHKFVENRVEEDDQSIENTEENTSKTKKLGHSEIFQLAIEKSIEVMSKCYEKITVQLDSDSDDDEEICRKYVLRPIQNFPYITRPLPHIIGSREWHEKWHAGLLESDDEPMDSEAKDDYYSDESDYENVSIPSCTNTASDRYSIPASESDISIGSAAMPKTLQIQNHSQNIFDDTISTSSKVSSHPQNVPKHFPQKEPVVPQNEFKSAVKVLPTLPGQSKNEQPVAAVSVLPPTEVPKKIEQTPRKGLFDNSDDEADIFQQDKNAKKSFFRGTQPERKNVNLFDDQPPIDNEYSNLDAAAKTKKSVNLFLESDDEEDYGPVSKNNKKVNLFDKDPAADAEVETIKSSNLFDKTDLSGDDFMKSGSSFGAKMGKKIVSLFDDDPPVDDFDEIFKPKGGKIEKNEKIIENNTPKVSIESKGKVKSVNLFGDYDDSDIFGSKNINSVKSLKVEEKMEAQKSPVPVIPVVQNQPKLSVNLFSDIVEEDLFTASHSKVFEKTDAGQSSLEVEQEVDLNVEKSDDNLGVDVDVVPSVEDKTEAVVVPKKNQLKINNSLESNQKTKKLTSKLFEDDEDDNDEDLFIPKKRLFEDKNTPLTEKIMQNENVNSSSDLFTHNDSLIKEKSPPMAEKFQQKDVHSSHDSFIPSESVVEEKSPPVTEELTQGVKIQSSSDTLIPSESLIEEKSPSQKEYDKNSNDLFTPFENMIEEKSSLATEKLLQKEEIVSPKNLFAPSDSLIEEKTEKLVQKEIESSEDIFTPIKIPNITEPPMEDDLFTIPEDIGSNGTPETSKTKSSFAIGLFDTIPPDDDIMDDKSNTRYYEDYSYTFKGPTTKKPPMPSFLFLDEPPDDDFGHDVVDERMKPPMKIDAPTIEEKIVKKPEIVEKEKSPIKINKLNKNININVAALLPGARRPSPSRTSDDINKTSFSPISKLPSPTINVDALLPGAKRPSKTSDNETSSGSPKSEAKVVDTAENSNILTNLNKSRPKIQSKRKPSTRNARKRQYQESVKQQMQQGKCILPTVATGKMYLTDCCNRENVSYRLLQQGKCVLPVEPSSSSESEPQNVSQKRPEKHVTKRISDNSQSPIQGPSTVKKDKQVKQSISVISAPVETPSTSKLFDSHKTVAIETLSGVKTEQQKKLEPLKENKLFDDHKSVSIESPPNVESEQQKKVEENKLFDDHKPASIESPPVVKNEQQKKVKSQNENHLNNSKLVPNVASSVSKRPETQQLFGDSDDDLFKPKMVEDFATKKPTESFLASTSQPTDKNIFGDSDDDDIFSDKSLKPKTKNETNNVEINSKNENAPKKSEDKKKSKLFDSDNDDDLFEKVPSKPKPVTAKQVSKSLFGDDDDDDNDLFRPKSSTSSKKVTQSLKKPEKKTIKSIPINDPLNLL